MGVNRFVVRQSLLLVAAAILAASGQAQESVAGAKAATDTPMLEEVYVSARRRTEDLQRTPVAVTAMSADDLKAYNVSNVGDITRVVPGLDRYEGRKEASYSIRGIGRGRSTDVGLDPSIGVYLDGIFLARHDSQLLDAVDIESIQVLRGPQGTLFGKNTIGGAILVTTREPANEFGGAFSGTVGSFGRKEAQISLDLPILSDKLLTRLTVGKRTADGWAEDVDSDREVGSTDSITVVGQAMVRFTDNLSVKLLAHYSDADEATEPYTCELTNPDGLIVTMRTPGNPQNYGEACVESSELIEDDKVNPENFGLSQGTDQLLVGATLSWETDIGEFKSITTYTERGSLGSNNNFDGTDVVLIINHDYVEQLLRSQGLISGEVNTRWGWGQEVQLNGELFDSRLNYTVGLFASGETLDKLIGGQVLTPEGYFGLTNLAGLLQAPPGTLFVLGAGQGDIRDLETFSYAAFGQASIDLTSDIQLTLGSRYTVEERELTAIDWNFASSTPPGFGGLPTVPGSPLPFVLMTEAQFNSLEGTTPELVLGQTQSSKLEFTNVSSMASLSWHVTDRFDIPYISDMMTYLTVAQGFKAGGFTTLYGQLATYEPEKLLSTEIGAKMDMFDRRLRLNLAAYNSDYTDMQMFVVQFDANFGGDFGTTNAGESLIQGAEVELTFLATQNLTLSVTSSYNKAEFKEYDDFAVNRITGDSQPIDRSNEPFPFVPEWTHSLALNYRLATEKVGNFDFTWLTTYRDEIFMGQDFKAGVPEFIDASTADAYSITSLRASWSPFADDSLRLSLFGNNVFDEDYVAWGVAIADNTGTNGVIHGEPVSWGVEFDYTFAQ